MSIPNKKYLEIQVLKNTPGFEKGKKYYFPCSSVDLSDGDCFEELKKYPELILDEKPIFSEILCPNPDWEIVAVYCVEQTTITTSTSSTTTVNVTTSTTASPTTTTTTLAPTGLPLLVAQGQGTYNGVVQDYIIYQYP